MKLNTLKPIVEKALKKYAICRQDDFILVYVVFKEISPQVARMSFADVIRTHEALGLPSIEGITRCRRKLMEEYPELKDANTTKARAEKIPEYVNFSKKV